MARNESLRSIPIFPLGPTASEKAFTDFFPNSRQAFESQIEIMKKHPAANDFLHTSNAILSDSKPTHKPTEYILGALILHVAARREAQIKRANVPTGKEDLLMEYLAETGLAYSQTGVIHLRDKETLDEFKQKEGSYMSVVGGRLGEVRYPSLLVGSALMWHYLKYAPGITSPSGPRQ